jgi:hypothetical protein
MQAHVREQLKTKSKIERDVETVKPTVINDKLIENYLVTYNKENKIFDQQDMRIWDLTHLSLSYKSKKRLDH